MELNQQTSCVLAVRQEWNSFFSKAERHFHLWPGGFCQTQTSTIIICECRWSRWGGVCVCVFSTPSLTKKIEHKMTDFSGNNRWKCLRHFHVVVCVCSNGHLWIGNTRAFCLWIKDWLSLWTLPQLKPSHADPETKPAACVFLSFPLCPCSQRV